MEKKGVYDIILLIRLNPSCEELLKKLKLFRSDTSDYEDLKRVILSQKWAYNFVGYITRDDLKYIINNKYVLPRNALLNGRMPMDAENYYVQAGDMRSVSELPELLKNRKECN